MKKIHECLYIPFVASNEEELRSVFPKSFAKLVGEAFLCPRSFPLTPVPPPLPPPAVLPPASPTLRESGGDGKYGDKNIPGEPKSTLKLLLFFGDRIGVRAICVCAFARDGGTGLLLLILLLILIGILLLLLVVEEFVKLAVVAIVVVLLLFPGSCLTLKLFEQSLLVLVAFCE